MVVKGLNVFKRRWVKAGEWGWVGTQWT